MDIRALNLNKGKKQNPSPMAGSMAASMASGNVPLVGQPYTLKLIIPQVLIVCNCGANEPVLINGVGQASQCRACMKLYATVACNIDAETNQANVRIMSRMPQPEPNTQPVIDIQPEAPSETALEPESTPVDTVDDYDQENIEPDYV